MNHKALWKIFLAALVYFVVFLAAQVFLSKPDLTLFSRFSDAQRRVLGAVFTLVISVPYYLIINGIFIKHYGRPIQMWSPPFLKNSLSHSLSKKAVILNLFLGIGLGFALTAVHFNAMQMLLNANQELSPEPLNRLFFQNSIVALIAMLSFPIGEELIFRAGLLHAFLNRKKVILGLILTSSVFGVLHLLNYLPFFGTWNGIGLVEVVSITTKIVSGLFLAYFYLRYGLFAVIVYHWMWNLATVANNPSAILGVAEVYYIIIAVHLGFFILSEIIMRLTGRGKLKEVVGSL